MALSDKAMWVLVCLDLLLYSTKLQMRLIRRLIDVLKREGANG